MAATSNSQPTMAPIGVAHPRLTSPGSVHICLYRTDVRRER